MRYVDHWTAEIVIDRFEEAVSTLRRLPKPKVYGYVNSWPEIVRDIHEIMGQETPPLRLGPPPADQISRMEQTLKWLWKLEPDECKIIWMRAEKMRWKIICVRFGKSREAMRIKHKMAIAKLCTILNSKNEA